MKKDIAKKLWINSVSNSRETEEKYDYVANEFCEVVEIALDEIAEEWENVETYSSEKKFKKKHQRLVSSYKLWLSEKEQSKNVQSQKIAIVQSFYNSLPDLTIDFDIPQGEVEYPNRDITHEEITKILNHSNVRERARFSMMSQGGLSPKNTVLLKYKYIKEDFEANRIPCCVKVPKEISKGSHRNHFTFIGEESVEYLRQYFETRGIPKDDDLIFLPLADRGETDNLAQRKSISAIFTRIVKDLKLIPEKEYEERKGKPKTLRLYNLRKFFRKHAGLAGVDYVNFWMGHSANYKADHVPSSDEHYFSKDDVDFHRKIYKEKSLPHLRIGSVNTFDSLEQGEAINVLQKNLGKAYDRIEELEQLVKVLASQRNVKRIVTYESEDMSTEEIEAIKEEFETS